MNKEILEDIIDILFEVLEKQTEANLILNLIVTRVHLLAKKFLPLIFSTLQAKGIAK